MAHVDLSISKNSAAKDRPLEITIHFVDGTSGRLSASRSGLCKESPYFVALANFNEGASESVEIKDIDPIGFDYILHWHEFQSSDVRPRTLKMNKQELTRAYIVADRLMMHRYRDTACSEFQKISSAKHPVTTLDLLYAQRLGLTTSSSLSTFMLRRIAWNWFYNGLVSDRVRKPDRLFIRGGEYAWALVQEIGFVFQYIGRAYDCWAEDPRPKKGLIHNSYTSSTGISRLQSLQRCNEPPESPQAKFRMQETIRKVHSRTSLLTDEFQNFVEHGGPFTWEFVKLWFWSLQCQLRLPSPVGWCQYHGNMNSGACPGWRLRRFPIGAFSPSLSDNHFGTFGIERV